MPKQPRGDFGGKGGGEEIKEGVTQNRLDYQPLVWEMNLSCLSYFLSSQGGVSLDFRKQQKSSPSPILLPTSLLSPKKKQIIRLLEKRNISLLNLLMSETINCSSTPLKGEEGRGYFTKFYTGRLCPEVQPLNLLHCIYTTLTKTVLLPNTFY